MIDVGASTLIKYGIGLALFLSFCLGLIVYGEHRKQLEWDAAITQQATLTASQIIDRARQDAKGVVQYIEVTGKAQVRTQIVEKEVVKYVDSPAQKCNLSPEFVWTFDTVSSLLNPSEDSLSPTGNAPGDTPPPTGATITDAEVLRAYEAAIIQYRDLWLAYTALVAWVRSGVE